MSSPENEFSLTRKAVDAELTPRGKFRLLRVAVLIIFVILIYQLAQVQLVSGERYKSQADQNRFRLIQTDALRGIIYDRSGKIIARNVPSFNISIVPADLEDADAERVFKDLSLILDIPISTAIQNTSDDVVGNLPPDLDRDVTPPRRMPGLRELVSQGETDPYTPVLIKANVSREIAFYLEERHLDFPGVRVSLAPAREYSEGPLLAHILGYVGRIPRETYPDYKAQGYDPNDLIGLAGIENSFESDLRGVKGRRYIEVDVAGREVARLGDEPPTPGHNLVLTIDAEFQKSVQTILQRALLRAHSRQGVALVLDPRKGEVLAMVSIPSYDNNLFAGGISFDDYTNLAQDPLHPLVNHAITGQYPPGSTYKLIDASAALQEKVLDINTRLTTPGIIWVPNKYYPDDPTLAQPFYDWYKPGFGSLTIREGLMESSDVFFYKVTGGESPNFDNGLGVERLSAYARMFGLGDLTGIDLTGEAKGLVPDPTWKRKTIGDVWTIGDTYNMGIGQGYVLATPLQVAQYTSVVANGGTLYKPQLVREIRDGNGAVLKTIEPQVIRRVPVDPQDFALVREGMRNAVTRGTATRANLQDVEVAAKTGTAEYYGPKVNGHLPTHAWFTAFAPYDNPQVVVTVFIYGGGEGSVVAAPVATDILRAYFRLSPDAPLAGAQPSGLTAAPPIAPPPAPRGTTARKYQGQITGVDAGGELPGIVGVVVDPGGRGINGVLVGADKCDGNIIFRETTDGNGAFNFKGVYWKDSARWCVRMISPSESELLPIQVEPYHRYIVQFAPPQ